MANVSPISHLDHTQTKHATGLDWPLTWKKQNS